MRKLFLALAALILVIGVLQFIPVQVGSQAQGESPHPQASEAELALTTSWGEPNLQGLWTAEYQTPLQRRPEYADREFLTEEEVAELDELRSKRWDRDYREDDRGTVHDLQGSYNSVYHVRKFTGQRTSLITDPPNGRLPERTPESLAHTAKMREFTLALLKASSACKDGESSCAGGEYGPPSPLYQSAVAPHYSKGNVNRANGPEDRGLGERCLGGYNLEFSNQNGFFRRIVQSPGGITMYYDSGQGQGWQRNIVMNGSPHLPSHVRQWWGDSRGHWEGDTLVVDVTNFTPKTSQMGASENLHMIERWTRTGPDTLEYTVTVDDPSTWTAPWTATQELQRQDNYSNRFYVEPRCTKATMECPHCLEADEQTMKHLPTELEIIQLQCASPDAPGHRRKRQVSSSNR